MRKTILVTGSSNGIGECIAKEFALNDFNVILHGRNRGDLERVKQEIQQKQVECSYVLGDLREIETIDELTSRAARSNLDILVNNAGYQCPDGYLDEIQQHHINATLDVNLKIPIELSRSIYPIFKKKGNGTIINMNSIVGIEPKKNIPIYTAARFGLRGFTESLRKGAKEDGIKVMGIYLTRVKTKPEFEWGMDPKHVAEQIYKFYANNEPDDLILDGRPKEFRPK